MKLSKLFDDVKIEASLPEIDVGHVCADTRQVSPGAVFFCLNGFTHDGHEYAKKALELGAAMVVVERDLGLGDQQILTPDTHAAYSICCATPERYGPVWSRTWWCAGADTRSAPVWQPATKD